MGSRACSLVAGLIDSIEEPCSDHVYRPRFLRHLVEAYAAVAAGGSCLVRMAAGDRKPCRSMSQVAS